MPNSSNYSYDIIIIGKTALLGHTASLIRSRQITSGFHFFWISQHFFYKARSSALRSIPNLKDQVPVFMSPSDRVAQLYPQTPGSLLSSSMTRKATVAVF
jgi:hypothetical protein